MIFNDTAAMRVDISQLERDGRDLLTKMGRVGVSTDLLREYEAVDSRIIGLRMRLVDDLRKIVVR